MPDRRQLALVRMADDHWEARLNGRPMASYIRDVDGHWLVFFENSVGGFTKSLILEVGEAFNRIQNSRE